MQSFRQFLTEVTTPSSSRAFLRAVRSHTTKPIVHPSIFQIKNVTVSLGAIGEYVGIMVLRSSTQGQGEGTQVMRLLCDLADEHGVTLGLDPVPLKRHPGQQRTTTTQLKTFYGRFGFVRNRGILPDGPSFIRLAQRVA